MPDRVIRERSRRSKSLAKISAEAERLFWRLVTYADDYGRFPADPDLILAGCFPRQASQITVEDVVRWYRELQAEKMVATWRVEDLFYGRLVNWGKDHRDPRAKTSKYPAPQSGTPVEDMSVSLTSDNTCQQMTADARRGHLTADAGHPLTNAPDLRSTGFDLDLRDSRSVSRDSRDDPDSRSEITPAIAASPLAEDDPAEFGWPPGREAAEPDSDSSQAQNREEQGPDPPPVDVARKAIRGMLNTLEGNSKMEPKIGPGEAKRRMREGDVRRQAATAGGTKPHGRAGGGA